MASRAQSHSHSSRWRLTRHQRYFSLVLLLPSAWLMVQGFLFISAALQDYQTQQWFDYWQEQTKKHPDYQIKEADYQLVMQGAKAALARQPLQADYLRHAAAAADWYVLRGERGSPSYAGAREEALAYFRQLTQLQPFWPENWFNLAVVKARQQQLDAEFNQAFIRALELGPWEKRLQKRAAELSFLLYDYVDGRVQGAMLVNWQRMAGFQPGELLKLAKQQQALNRVCPLFPEPMPKACISQPK